MLGGMHWSYQYLRKAIRNVVITGMALAFLMLWGKSLPESSASDCRGVAP